MQKKERKEKSKTQSQKWKTSTKAACKFEVYVNILKMKSCSAARPHLEVKVQTGQIWMGLGCGSISTQWGRRMQQAERLPEAAVTALTVALTNESELSVTFTSGRETPA